MIGPCCEGVGGVGLVGGALEAVGLVGGSLEGVGGVGLVGGSLEAVGLVGGSLEGVGGVGLVGGSLEGVAGVVVGHSDFTKTKIKYRVYVNAKEVLWNVF